MRSWIGGSYRLLQGKKGVQYAYDQMADRYDTSKHLNWTRRMEEGEARVIEIWLADLLTPVLDAGCGTGRYAGKIAERGRTVIAMDFSLRMLKKAKNKLREYVDAGKIQVVQGDCEHIPLRTDSVGGLVCTLTLDHFEDCELGAYEFSRVLKQGGLCILSTFNSRTLGEVQRRLRLPAEKIPFETEDMPPTLVHEVGHSAEEVEALFSKNRVGVVDMKGCCYWHLLPLFLTGRYTISFDVLFSRFKSLFRYAEIHVTRMVKD